MQEVHFTKEPMRLGEAGVWSSRFPTKFWYQQGQLYERLGRKQISGQEWK